MSFIFGLLPLPTYDPPIDNQEIIEIRYLVTVDFVDNENLNLSTGLGSINGETIKSTGNIILPLLESIFNINAKCAIYRNGVYQQKGSDVIWVSTNLLKITKALEVGEILTVSSPEV